MLVDHEVQMHAHGKQGHEEWPLYLHITLRYETLWRRVVVYSHMYFIFDMLHSTNLQGHSEN